MVISNPIQNDANGSAAASRAGTPGAVTVLQIGPRLEETGGMTTVCRHLAAQDWGGKYRVVHFAATHAPHGCESFRKRLIRHVRHLSLLRHTIGECGARVVHIHTCSGFSFYRFAMDGWAARRAGCRVVLHVHGAGFDRFCAEASTIEALVIRRVLHRADAVISLSRGWGEALRAFAPKARIVVVENAVEERIGDWRLAIDDSVQVAARPPARREGIPEEVGAREDSRTSSAKVLNDCHFLLLARMDVWKGVDDLLAACEVLRVRGAAFRVTLAGPGGSAGDGAELARKIAAAGLTDCVRYVGAVEGAEKERLWSETDVLVQPSHQEGMPMSLLEALMRGIPAVATRVGAVPEVITNGREGWLVAPRAVDELAAAMQRMIDDRVARETMGRAARELARRRFSLERLARDVEMMYSRLLQEDRATHSGPCDETDLKRPARKPVSQRDYRLQTGARLV